MIIVLKPIHQEEDVHRIVRRLEDLGLRAHISKGEHRTIIGAIGDERILREVPLESLPGYISCSCERGLRYELGKWLF